MRSRRSARETALQALYQCDTLNEWDDESIDLFFTSFTAIDSLKDGTPEIENHRFCEGLIQGVRAQLEFLDEQISRASTHWNLERMSRVDRNILRLAAFELAFVEEIPTNVSINEAIEIAKRFGADDTPMFVNGVLDKLANLLRQDSGILDQQKRKERLKRVVNE
jgi:N utilization substance protein B